MTTWIKDKNGNKCSVEYFGSEKEAQRALASLVACKNCINSSDCSFCSRCSRCSDCSLCYDCYDCFRCSCCSRCSGCSRCSDLEDKKGPAPKVPKIKNIHKKILDAVEKDGLEMGDWHTCYTTHCRAGWAVHLAGKAGYALEEHFNTSLAAQLIYRESGYKINPARFYDSNEDALADIERCARIDG